MMDDPRKEAERLIDEHMGDDKPSKKAADRPRPFAAKLPAVTIAAIPLMQEDDKRFSYHDAGAMRYVFYGEHIVYIIHKGLVHTKEHVATMDKETKRALGRYLMEVWP